MPPVKSKIATKTSTRTKVLILTVAVLLLGLAAIGYGYGLAPIKPRPYQIRQVTTPTIAPTKIKGCAGDGQEAAKFTLGCCDINSPIVNGICQKSLGCGDINQKAADYGGKCCIGLENVGGICTQTCADLFEAATSTPSGKCCADLKPDDKGLCMPPQ